MAREFIEKQDTLNEGREKLNRSITRAYDADEKSDEAFSISNEAKSTSQTAEEKADSVQNQFNQVVIDGDSSVEAAQARVAADGTTYPVLKERLDEEHEKVTTQLAQIEVHINTFGAIGDANYKGSDGYYYSDLEHTKRATDNFDAIQSAADFCKTNNYKLVIDEGRYLVGGFLDFEDIKEIDSRGEIAIASHLEGGVGIKVGTSKNGGSMENANIRLSVIHEKYLQWESKGIGIEVKNIFKSKILIERSIYFKVGVRFTGEDNGDGSAYGFTWNNVRYNSVRGNKTNFLLDTYDRTAYTNENTFIGTQLAGADIGIQIGNNELPDKYLNHNTFINPCLETNKTAIYIPYGVRNHFTNARLEDTDLVARFENRSSFNFVEVGIESGKNFVDDSDTRQNFVYRKEDTMAKKSAGLQFNFTTLSKENDNLYTPKMSMRHSTANNVLVQGRTTPDYEVELVGGQTASLSNQVAIGVLCDVSKVRDLLLSQHTTGNAFFVLIPFDENGERYFLEDEDTVVGAGFTNLKNSYFVNSFGGAFWLAYDNTTNYYSNNQFRITFNKNVKRIWVGVTGGGSASNLRNWCKGFSIDTTSINPVFIEDGNSQQTMFEPPIYALRPPTTGYNARGRLCYNTRPDLVGYVGWVCTVAGEPGTWQPFGKIENLD